MKDEAVNWIIAKLLYPEATIVVATPTSYGIPARVFVHSAHDINRCNFIQSLSWSGLLISKFCIQLEPWANRQGWLAKTDINIGPSNYSEASEKDLMRAICFAIVGATYPELKMALPVELR